MHRPCILCSEYGSRWILIAKDIFKALMDRDLVDVCGPARPPTLISPSLRECLVSPKERDTSPSEALL